MKKQFVALPTAVLILGIITGCNTAGTTEGSGDTGVISDSDSSYSGDPSSISQYQNNETSSDANLTSADSLGSKNESVLPAEAVKQILKPLKDYGDLYWEMFPFDLNEELVDKTQTISAERGDAPYGIHTQTFYKVVNGDIQTESQFIAKLDSMLTEKMKKDFLENSHRPFEFSDGDLYISGRGAGGMGAGMDALYLDSIEYTDDNTVVVTAVSFGEKNKWGTSEDIKDTATATLVKTADGFRIDECEDNTTIYFYFYDEIEYGGEKFKL